MNKKITFAAFLSVALMLASCGGGSSSSQQQTTGDTSEEKTTSTTQQTSTTSEPKPAGKLASGTFDLSTQTWQEKTKIVAALEKYAMENHTAGIPLYDDASYEQFSERLHLPSRTYLTNYGFGVAYGSIEGENMVDGKTIVETNPKWRSYFHGYTSTDSGTFNGWDATGADVSERMSMISSSYFGVKANDAYTDYEWVASLAKTNEPIMLDAEGNPVDLSGLSQDERDSMTSQFWRVPLHTGAGYTYRYVGKSSLAKYDGMEVKIEDYLTPFKMMLNNKLVRYAELVSDAGGLQGAMEYVYDKNKQTAAATDWTKSGVGVQISPDGEGLDFAFIQPKSISYARTNLSSQLYSPVPESFIKDIGGIKNYGQIGKAGAEFDNILCFGAYVPEYWEQGKKIVFEKNATYYEASDFHYDGYTEVIFEGESSDENAYKAFLNGELDEVTIPTKYIKDNKDKGLPTKGSTIIKLNINSCTDEEWEYYFGEHGTIYPHEIKDYWAVKPIMSNEDFLNGLYFAINRKALAEKAGRNPAMGYLSDAYMLDPAGKVSYRSTEEGKAVLANYNKAAGGEENYGYSSTYAQTLFKNAAKQVVEQGYYDPDDTIEILGLYRYQTTIDNLGKDLEGYIEEAFNKGAEAAGYPNLKLDIKLEVGGSSYTDTYTRMDHGEYDFAEGAISGNVLNPLEFMNTMSSTKALNQGFNLNWGHRTDLVSDKHPAKYVFTDGEGKEQGGLWSFDALYNASQGFTPVDEGVTTPIASNEQFVDSGKNIIWRAEFPANATDDEGNSLFKFSLSDFAILTCNSGTPGQYGGYASATLTQDNNGFINIRFSKEEVTKAAAYGADGEKKAQKVFALWFTLVYSVTLPSGTITKATQIISAPQSFSDFGIDPVSPSNL